MSEKIDQKDEWRIREFDIRDYATWIPTYGGFCGPKWSAWKRTADMTAEDAKAKVLKTNVNGVERDSAIDLACREHDIAYQEAKGQPNEKFLVHKADSIFHDTVEAELKTDTLSDMGRQYGSWSVKLFKGKKA